MTSAEIDGAEAYEVSGTLIWLLISYLEGNIGFYVLIDLGSSWFDLIGIGYRLGLYILFLCTYLYLFNELLRWNIHIKQFSFSALF